MASSTAHADEPQSYLAFEPSDVPNRFGWVEQSSGLPEHFHEAELLSPLGADAESIRWLGALSLGDANSRSVAIAVGGPQADQLWVDLNRDRQFSPAEKFFVSDSGPPTSSLRNWSVPVDCEYAAVGNDDSTRIKHVPYRMHVQFEAELSHLKTQTAGTMVGTAVYLGREVAARYEDRNANGRWFDAEDRIFVDLNGDGRLDSLVERLPARGLKVIRNTLLAINGDSWGRSLTLAKVNDKGSVIPTLELAERDGVVETLDATLASSSGFRIRLTSVDQSVEVPVGNYRVQSVRATVRARSGKRYSFDFVSDRTEPTFTIEPHSEVSQSLLGPLTVTGRMSLDSSKDQLVITASLRSATNLYLADCNKGQASLVENRLQTKSSYRGVQVAVGSSGFS